MERVIVIPMTGKFYNLLQIALLQCMLMEFNISTLGSGSHCLLERHATVEN